MRIDPIRDNYEIAQIKVQSKRSGVLYVAGGTPKNYISQTEVIQEVLGFEENPHMYAAQITMDMPHWGGLSGCTFEESQSWGKFHKDAKMAQAHVEATDRRPASRGRLPPPAGRRQVAKAAPLPVGGRHPRFPLLRDG